MASDQETNHFGYPKSGEQLIEIPHSSKNSLNSFNSFSEDNIATSLSPEEIHNVANSTNNFINNLKANINNNNKGKNNIETELDISKDTYGNSRKVSFANQSLNQSNSKKNKRSHKKFRDDDYQDDIQNRDDQLFIKGSTETPSKKQQTNNDHQNPYLRDEQIKDIHNLSQPKINKTIPIMETYTLVTQPSNMRGDSKNAKIKIFTDMVIEAPEFISCNIKNLRVRNNDPNNKEKKEKFFTLILSDKKAAMETCNADLPIQGDSEKGTFRFKLYTNEIANQSLSSDNISDDQENSNLDRIVPAAPETNQKTRVIQVIDIPQYITKDLIAKAFNRYGAIEQIAIKNKNRGKYMQAYITFKSDEKLKSFEDDNWYHFINNEVCRVCPIILNKEKREQRNKYRLKLSNIPRKLNTKLLQPIIENTKAKGIFRPLNKWNYSNNRNNNKYENYIILYFENQESMNIAFNTTLTFGSNQLYWSDENTPICRICGNSQHTKINCPFHRRNRYRNSNDNNNNNNNNNYNSNQRENNYRQRRSNSRRRSRSRGRTTQNYYSNNNNNNRNNNSRNNSRNNNNSNNYNSSNRKSRSRSNSRSNRRNSRSNNRSRSRSNSRSRSRSNRRNRNYNRRQNSYRNYNNRSRRYNNNNNNYNRRNFQNSQEENGQNNWRPFNRDNINSNYQQQQQQQQNKNNEENNNNNNKLPFNSTKKSEEIINPVTKQHDDYFNDYNNSENQQVQGSSIFNRIKNGLWSGGNNKNKDDEDLEFNN
jgi:hypothetical protein